MADGLSAEQMSSSLPRGTARSDTPDARDAPFLQATLYPVMRVFECAHAGRANAAASRRTLAGACIVARKASSTRSNCGAGERKKQKYYPRVAAVFISECRV